MMMMMIGFLIPCALLKPGFSGFENAKPGNWVQVLGLYFVAVKSVKLRFDC